MRKSRDLKSHYRPGTSRGPVSLATFREQMTDYARGDVLLELRAQARKSRESVAAEIGVTTKTLFTWENKNGAIKWANAQKIATFYGVDAESLITRDADEAAGLPSRDQLEQIQQAQVQINRKLDLLLMHAGLIPADAPAAAPVPTSLPEAPRRRAATRKQAT